mmetsp:Transcript_18184/g.39150  ORF Transcript_18184/g.39150 Transcript_18184/m.39150 type:complete len:200 (-) Transcript_18184:779-1378(-)
MRQHTTQQRPQHIVAHEQALARLSRPLDPAMHGLQQGLEPAVAVEGHADGLSECQQGEGAAAGDAATRQARQRPVCLVGGDGLADVTPGGVHAGEERPAIVVGRRHGSSVSSPAVAAALYEGQALCPHVQPALPHLPRELQLVTQDPAGSRLQRALEVPRGVERDAVGHLVGSFQQLHEAGRAARVVKVEAEEVAAWAV